jgi:hypothetical protein
MNDNIDYGIFIPNTKKRYSIDKKGEVYSHYRFLNNGKKQNHIFKIRRYTQNNNKTLLVSLVLDKGAKNKVFYITTLMETCYNLQKPDNYHFYDLRYKDNDFTNTSLDNLIYKIRLQKDSNYNFYPQPFYDNKGNITHKICGVCGEKKNINDFHLQLAKRQNENNTYRNMCESCRAKRRWQVIKSDKDLYEKYMLKGKEWANSKEGILYYKNYRINYNIHERDNLTPHYISTSLRMKINELTPTLIELSKKRIKLKRQIKNQTNIIS